MVKNFVLFIALKEFGTLIQITCLILTDAEAKSQISLYCFAVACRNAKLECDETSRVFLRTLFLETGQEIWRQWKLELQTAKPCSLTASFCRLLQLLTTDHREHCDQDCNAILHDRLMNDQRSTELRLKRLRPPVPCYRCPPATDRCLRRRHRIGVIGGRWHRKASGAAHRPTTDGAMYTLPAVHPAWCVALVRSPTSAATS